MIPRTWFVAREHTPPETLPVRACGTSVQPALRHVLQENVARFFRLSRQKDGVRRQKRHGSIVLLPLAHGQSNATGTGAVARVICSPIGKDARYWFSEHPSTEVVAEVMRFSYWRGCSPRKIRAEYHHVARQHNTLTAARQLR